jgi:fructokinase
LVKPVRLGAVEVGGTKVLCLVGSDPDHIVAQDRIPTGKPAETLAQVLAFFQQEVSSGGPLAAIGIASFGPLELRRSHPRYGFITSSPKPGWSYVDMVGPARRALGVPVGFDTDVNAAALGESRWGAARGLDTFVYLTVGTGIGAGAVVEGRIIHGLGHPEMGHLSVPQGSRPPRSRLPRRTTQHRLRDRAATHRDRRRLYRPAGAVPAGAPISTRPWPGIPG